MHTETARCDLCLLVWGLLSLRLCGKLSYDYISRVICAFLSENAQRAMLLRLHTR